MIMSWQELYEKNYIAMDCKYNSVINSAIPEGDLITKYIFLENPQQSRQSVICPNAKLTKLILAEDTGLNYDYFSGIIDKEFTVTGGGFDNCTNLTEIHFLGDMGICSVGNATRQKIIESLKTCTNLKSLNMSQKSYDMYGWQDIVNIINESRTEDNLVKINIIY